MIKKIWVLSLIFAWILMVPPLLAAAMPSTVNINNAGAEVLASQLKGVGLKKAGAIVEYRKKNGPFAAIEDIVLVKGIGWKTMEANRDNIRLRDKALMQTGDTTGDGVDEKSAKGKSSSKASDDNMKPGKK